MTTEKKMMTSSMSIEFGMSLNSSFLKEENASAIKDSLLVADSLELSVDYLFNGGSSYVSQLLDGGTFKNLHLFGRQMSIASIDPLDRIYLSTLKNLCDRYQARTAGDFFAWTGVGGRHLHALMPAVLNRSMLSHLKSRIAEVQDFLGRPLILENAPTPVAFKASEFTEPEFFRLLAKETGALFALNLTTVYSNSLFQEFDPEAYLKQLDWNSIYQVKISLLGEDAKSVSGSATQSFDRSLWSLMGIAGQLMGSAKNNKYQIIIRDEAGVGATVSGKWLTTARLMLKESLRGTQGTSRVSSPSAS